MRRLSRKHQPNPRSVLPKILAEWARIESSGGSAHTLPLLPAILQPAVAKSPGNILTKGVGGSWQTFRDTDFLPEPQFFQATTKFKQKRNGIARKDGRSAAKSDP
jgi:hypothetical protein